MPESHSIAGYQVAPWNSNVFFKDEYIGVTEKISAEDAIALGHRLVACGKKAMEFTLANHDESVKEKAQNDIQNRGSRWA